MASSSDKTTSKASSTLGSAAAAAAARVYNLYWLPPLAVCFIFPAPLEEE